MRTANPALSAKSFGGFVGVRSDAPAMTIQGAVNRTAILLAVVMVAALWPWRLFFRTGDPTQLFPYLAIGSIAGFVLALVTIFKKDWSPVTAPIYAGCEGLVLGSLSALFEARYPGIAFQATALTLGVLAVLLIAYKTGAIKATEKFRMGVFAATGAVCVVYMLSFVLRMFGVEMPFLHSTGTVGIGISLVIVVIAALNLVLDFDFIEQGAARGAPRFMEWYAAFGLLLTLVWLYLEILRLLARLASRRD